MRVINNYFSNLSISRFIKNTGLFILFSIAILPVMFYWMKEVTGTSLSPDTNLGFDINVYYSIREIYGVIGRKIYIIQRYTFDLLWPFVYTVFLMSLIGRFKQYFGYNDKLFIVPIIAVTLDICENIIATVFMVMYPKTVDGLLYVLMMITNLKWLILFVISVILIVQLMTIVVKKRNK